MYIGSQLTPKLSFIFTQFALEIESSIIKYFINRNFIVYSNWFTFYEETPISKNIFHINGYPKKIIDNHVKTFLSEQLMNTDSCQNTSNEEKYSVIIPFIGHPSIILNCH